MAEPLDCRVCDFTYDEDAAHRSAEAIRSGTRTISEALRRPDQARRPAPDTWSPLEVACHVRDVLITNRERVIQALVESGITPKPMFRDERVELDGYAEQDPAAVARQVADAGLLFANVLDRMSGDQWDHTVIYGYPEIAEQNLRWIAVHTEHEVRHHVGDVLRG